MNSIEPKLITAGSRPASVAYRGGIVYIHHHDVWYLKIRQAMLDDIMALHPDTKRQFAFRRRNGQCNDADGTHRVLKHMMRLYVQWMANQRLWYKEFKMQPPKFRARFRSNNKRPLYDRPYPTSTTVRTDAMKLSVRMRAKIYFTEEAQHYV